MDDRDEWRDREREREREREIQPDIWWWWWYRWIELVEIFSLALKNKSIIYSIRQNYINLTITLKDYWKKNDLNDFVDVSNNCLLS